MSWAVRFVCVLLTQRGVVEREVSQESGVLRQDEQTPGVAVPHQGTPGTVLQHSVLDDLCTHDRTTHFRFKVSKRSRDESVKAYCCSVPVYPIVNPEVGLAFRAQPW